MSGIYLGGFTIRTKEYDFAKDKYPDDKEKQRAYIEGYQKAKYELRMIPEDVTVLLNIIDEVKKLNGTMEDVCRLFNGARQ